jgi:type II secretory pathway component GspD/PulD (secretin)
MTNTLTRSLLLGLCVLALTAQADQQVLEVITLGYRQADEVLPMLRPLLAPGGTLTGMGNRLIVRTTPENLAQLKQVLAAIDSKPRQLLISVRQSSIADASRDAASVSGTVGGGGNATVTVPRPPGAQRDPGVVVQSGRTRIEGRAISSSSTQAAGVTQTLQVLEGNSAFIRVGQSAPVTSTEVTSTPSGTRITQNTEFVDAGTGFYVTPRVSGDRVTLEISTERSRVRNPNTGAVNVQRVGTVVSGRLGEWIEVGGSSENVERTQSDLLAQRREESRDERRVMLKVEEVR